MTFLPHRKYCVTGAALLLPVAFGLGTTAHAGDITYTNIPYSLGEANFTGIRGTNIVGNVVIPGTGGASSGVLYEIDSGTWVSIPTATANNVNYPGATTQLPYGPSFGSPGGIFSVVGSYKTAASSANIGYVFDSAAAPGAQYTSFVYPSSPGVTVANTIPHSQFGNYVVGNYDTTEGAGSAFIYDKTTQSFTSLVGPGAIVTTAYGIYGNKVAGGYTDSLGLNAQHGYLYDMATGTFTTYDHPGAIATHFQGITGGGRHGEYNLGADWIDASGGSHAAILHINADGTYFWTELDVPGSSLTSVDSLYGGDAVGFYFTSDGTMLNYLATVPGVYDPIRNAGLLTVATPGATGLSGISGDDIVNDGTILVTGANATGIAGDTYGVLTNNGSITATGQNATAVRLSGLDGTLLNTGTITAAPGALAIATGATADGTAVVNDGTIDGLVSFTPSADGRFENSGWLGISGTGAGATHQIAGVFAQTASGTLALRISGAQSDSLKVAGAARLNGTLLAAFAGPTGLQRTYTVVTASGGVTGSFATLSTEGLPVFITPSLTYGSDAVALSLTSDLAATAGTTTNEQAVGSAIDSAINTGTSSGATATNLGTLPSGLSAFYGLSAAALPAALASLSGEAYASEQTVLLGDSSAGREAVLGRLRQSAYGAAAGPVTALGTSGPATASGGSKAPADLTFWGQGLGNWTNYNGTDNAASVHESLGGFVSGADVAVGSLRLGGAIGYTQSNATMSGVSSTATTNSLLLGLYGGGAAGPVGLRFGVMHAFNQTDADRSIAFSGFDQQASGSYGGGTTQIFGEVSHAFAIRTVAVEPFGGLAWVHLNTDGVTESSAGGAGLTVASTTDDIGYGSLGLRTATDVPLANGMVLVPHASAAWQHTFGGVTSTATMSFTQFSTTTFGVSGVPLATNTALLDAGLDLKLSAQARIGLSYLGQVAGNVTANGVQASFNWCF
ncbi:autotransporter outer membrane beta-barrel domain-containing protein [Acidisoma sp. 7E03]